MSKIINNNEFIKKLKEIAKLPTTYYSVAGGNWAKWNGTSWNFDCVILIKAILWGWNGNKEASHGGAIYASNGVYDDNADQIINRCYDISTDFSNIAIGELLWMNGHVGIFIGQGEVIECTAAWEGKVLSSNIDSKGRRIRNGIQVGCWKKHGKLPYIEYITQINGNINTNTEVNIFYRVKTEKHGWLPEVCNLEDYAGWEDSTIVGLAMRTDKGSLRYRATTVSGKVLGWVTGCDINDYINGWAGNNEPIATIEAEYFTPDDIVKSSGYKYLYYKVNEYPYQIDLIRNITNGLDGYAGIKGQPITKFQAEIK